MLENVWRNRVVYLYFATELRTLDAATASSFVSHCHRCRRRRTSTSPTSTFQEIQDKQRNRQKLRAIFFQDYLASVKCCQIVRQHSGFGQKLQVATKTWNYLICQAFAELKSFLALAKPNMFKI